MTPLEKLILLSHGVLFLLVGWFNMMTIKWERTTMKRMELLQEQIDLLRGRK